MREFLTIDGVLIADLESGSYKAYEKDLDVYQRMIAGNMVCEARGSIWVVEVAYSAIDAQTLSNLRTAMSASRLHTLAFLPPNGGNTLYSSEFYLTSKPSPSLTSWVSTDPEWGGLSFVFEEVAPHD